MFLFIKRFAENPLQKKLTRRVEGFMLEDELLVLEDT